MLTLSPLTSAQTAENTVDLTHKVPLNENFYQEENVTFLPLESYIHSNNNLKALSNNDLKALSSGIIIRTGYDIKNQGYMTNKQLLDYVEYVDKQAKTLGWTILISGFLTKSAITIAPAVLMQFAGGEANFDIVKKQAYAGYGMGWAHMYANGNNTLSVIPRRDFSNQHILYTK